MPPIHRPYLEYDVVEHCNLRCDGCTHYSPYMKPAFADVDSFKKDITELAKVLHVARFRLLGGEPFLHKRILDFLMVAKESKIATEVGICTNGVLAHRIAEEIFQNVDLLDVSFYKESGVDYFELQALIAGKAKQYGFEYRIMVKHNFREINIDEEIKDEARVTEIYRTCAIAHHWNCHSFKDGKYYKCAKPIYQNKYFDRVGIKTDINYVDEDCLEIHQDGLQAKLLDYITTTKPMKACAFCLGTTGTSHAHKQLSKDEVRAKLSSD